MCEHRPNCHTDSFSDRPGKSLFQYQYRIQWLGMRPWMRLSNRVPVKSVIMVWFYVANLKSDFIENKFFCSIRSRQFQPHRGILIGNRNIKIEKVTTKPFGFDETVNLIEHFIRTVEPIPETIVDFLPFQY